MPHLSRRLADLSPERRRLLEQMLEKKSPDAAPPAQARPAATRPDPLRVSQLAFDPGATVDQQKAHFKQFYNSVNRQLDATEAGSFSFFLNYGYVADQNPQASPIELPEYFLNRNSVKLLLEVIGDRTLEDCRVLDIGCGRGGAAQVLRELFDVTNMVGLDLSAAAMAFCKKTHRGPGVHFLQGDAERVPFGEESFDVVINVESSHLYSDKSSFYSEVSRILKPGGWFLYADLFSAEESSENVDFLKSLGFEIQRETDITSNVLLSCDSIAAIRQGAFAQGNDDDLMSEFLCLPGSDLYQELVERETLYRLLNARKPTG